MLADVNVLKWCKRTEIIFHILLYTWKYKGIHSRKEMKQPVKKLLALFTRETCGIGGKKTYGLKHWDKARRNRVLFFRDNVLPGFQAGEGFRGSQRGGEGGGGGLGLWGLPLKGPYQVPRQGGSGRSPWKV